MRTSFTNTYSAREARTKGDNKMDQKTILAALQHALNEGNGSLDDLSNLLSRAQADIETAKKEQAEAEARAKKEAEKAKFARGEKIAELATRLLEGKPTSADVALVFETYLKSKGYDDVKISAESIEEGLEASRELNKHLSELTDALGDLFNLHKSQKNDPDKALNDFLKGMGLR